MALLGMFGNKKPRFGGTDSTYNTPGIGDGQPGATPGGLDPFNPVATPQQPKQRSGIGMGIAEAVLAYGAANGSPLGQSYFQNKFADQRDARRAQAEAEEQRRRQFEPTKLGDSIIRLNPQTGEYETMFSAPKTPQPTEFERQLDAAGFGEEEKARLRQDFVRNRANPLQGVQGFDAGGNPTMTFIRPSASAPANSGPAIGTVEDGYRFKGGNPADPSSWEPAGGAGPGQRGFP